MRDRLEQIARLAPVTARSKHKCLIALSGNDFLMRMIAREDVIERPQRARVAWLQRRAAMFFYKPAQPFPQRARPCCDTIQLGASEGCIQVHVETFSQPVQIRRSIIEPVDWFSQRRHNRIEKIQRQMIGDEKWIGSRFR